MRNLTNISLPLLAPKNYFGGGYFADSQRVTR